MIRKIIRIGNSEGVTLPIAELRAMKLKPGDSIEIFLGKEIETIRKNFINKNRKKA